ncbi:MAG: HEAT repeat domain-containing protein [Acidobacteria bacterium]|nr:MAG: HEAT repeat domain-containing protein [Acidobacteriota bacterium]
MIGRIALRLMILVFLLTLHPSWASAQDWEWGSVDDNPLTWVFYEQLPIIVVGRVVGVRSVPGVTVNKRGSISGVKLYTVEVEQVVKGSGILPFEELPVLVVPRVVVNPPLGPHLRHLEGRLHLPPRRQEIYPDLPVGQRRLFGLFPATLSDPTGEVVWKGIEALSAEGPLYGYSLSYPVSQNGKEVRVVRRYKHILSLKDQEKRIRRLAVYSLRWLRDPRASEVVQLGAVENLRGIHVSWAWGRVTQRLGNGQVIVGPASRLTAEYLTAAEVNELVRMTLDRRRSAYVRSNLIWALKELVEYGHRRLRPEPFVRLLQDRSEDHDVRWNAIFLLEQIGGPVVRQAFRELLLEEPTEDERMLRYRVKESPILKSRP